MTGGNVCCKLVSSTSIKINEQQRKGLFSSSSSGISTKGGKTPKGLESVRFLSVYFPSGSSLAWAAHHTQISGLCRGIPIASWRLFSSSFRVKRICWDSRRRRPLDTKDADGYSGMDESSMMRRRVTGHEATRKWTRQLTRQADSTRRHWNLLRSAN